MKFEVYEYIIKDKNAGIYIGSFTLKENANKQIVKKLNAYLVETYKRGY